MATRDDVEFVLLKRAGKMLTLLELDGTTVGGNTDLVDPINFAMRQLGYTLTTISSVTAADVVAVDSTELDELLDRAELRLLENLRVNCDLVDISVGTRFEYLGQARITIDKAIADQRRKVSDLWGDIVGDNGSAALRPGLIQLSFAEQDNDTTEVTAS